MEKKEQNLRPQLWKPGQSGNPKGRPKKERFIPDILIAIGSEKTPPFIISRVEKMFPDAKNMTMLQALMRVVYVKAITGMNIADMAAVNYISERTEGKVKDSRGIEGNVDMSEVVKALRERFSAE